MKATLEFTLPEEEPEFRTACLATEYKSALEAVREHLRARLKHHRLTMATRAELEEARRVLYEASPPDE